MLKNEKKIRTLNNKKPIKITHIKKERAYGRSKIETNTI
jgi:hypothetical protein